VDFPAKAIQCGFTTTLVGCIEADFANPSGGKGYIRGKTFEFPMRNAPKKTGCLRVAEGRNFPTHAECTERKKRALRKIPTVRTLTNVGSIGNETWVRVWIMLIALSATKSAR
jgi:hypothetical protein